MAYSAGFDGPLQTVVRRSPHVAANAAEAVYAMPDIIVPKPNVMLEAMSAFRRAGSGAQRGFTA
jgi:hypothetical protein